MPSCFHIYPVSILAEDNALFVFGLSMLSIESKISHFSKIFMVFSLLKGKHHDVIVEAESVSEPYGLKAKFHVMKSEKFGNCTFNPIF